MAAAVAPVYAAPAATASAKAVYKDANAPIEARVDDLLARMTLEEKIVQITAVWDGKVEVFDTNLQLDPAKLAARYPNGLGQFTRPSDAKGSVSPRVARAHPGADRCAGQCLAALGDDADAAGHSDPVP
jgi:beta-glucosidase